MFFILLILLFSCNQNPQSMYKTNNVKKNMVVNFPVNLPILCGLCVEKSKCPH